MNTSIQFGPADRDDRGFVKAPTPPQEPRSLADLLPTPHSIQIDAQRPAQPRVASKTEQALLAIALLLVIAVAVWRLGIGGDVAPASPDGAPAATQASGEGATPPSPRPVTMLPAYSAPDVPLGQIEATRAITPTAHYGQNWIQAIVSGSGRIWLRASDWPSLAIVGPDLAPPPVPAAVPAPVSAPAVFVPEATAPPPPPPCASAGVPGKMVEVCGDGDLEQQAKEKWIATYGGNVGIVGTPSPQIMRQP